MRAARAGLLNAVEMAQIQTSDEFGIEYMQNFAVVAKWIDSTVADFTFVPGDVNTGTDEISETGHGLITGQLVRVSTDTTLPSPLLAATDYYVIRIDDDLFQLADTYAEAIAGTQINITTQGSGIHTLDTLTFGGAVKLQYAVVKDPEEADWVDVDSGSITIPGAGSPLGLEFLEHGALSLRGVYTPTGGSGSITFNINAKGIG